MSKAHEGMRYFYCSVTVQETVARSGKNLLRFASISALNRGLLEGFSTLLVSPPGGFTEPVASPPQPHFSVVAGFCGSPALSSVQVSVSRTAVWPTQEIIN